MDPRLYQAVATGDDETTFDNLSEQLLFSKMLSEKTPENNSVLHVAALYKRQNVVKKILTHIKLSILYHKNSDGDTALHVAAREGCQEIVQLLIDYENEKGKELSTFAQLVLEMYFEKNGMLTEMTNHQKDSAIHVAVRNGHLSVVEKLIKGDSRMALLRNGVGESPLFLAVEGKFFDIARFLLENTEKCSYKGRDGMNALHVAMVYLHEDSNANSSGNNSELNGLVKDINDKCGAAVGEQDKFGWTPLHYAVHFGLEEAVELFLANTDRSIAYKKDKEGMCAFHVATKNGHIVIMEKLRSICPDISELLTHNGENALHVAVKVRKKDVVESILKTLGSNNLLNKQDKDGNTPLHLAAIIEDYEILVMLLNDKRVKANIVSKDGLTAMDITQSSTKLGVSEKLDLISKLKSIGGFCSLKQQHIKEPNMASQNINASPPLEDQRNKEHQLEKFEGIKATDEEEEIAKDFDPFLWMIRPFLNPSVAKEAVEMDRLIATIIATVTFAAAFQVPGGYESGGPFQGLPVLRHRTLFKLFLIFDALAFGLSSSSMFLHFVATMFGPGSALLVFKKVKKDRTNLFLQVAQFLTFYSILAIVATFFSGIYLVAGKSHGIKAAAYVCVAGFLSGIFYVRYFQFLIWYLKFIKKHLTKMFNSYIHSL